MKKIDPQIVKDEWQTHFGSPITVEQARFLDKMARHIRGRCRNNQALIRYYKECFPHLEIKMEDRTDDKGNSYKKVIIDQ